MRRHRENPPEPGERNLCLNWNTMRHGARLFRRSAPVLISKRNCAAFTLIEVVIAVALFAMASVILTSTFVNALQARDRVTSNDERDTDTRTVRLQLLLEPNLDNAEEGDRIETLSNGAATWRAQIEPTEVIDLFTVRFEIEFQDPQEGQIATYSEILYLLRPTWSKSAERSDLLQDKKDALNDSREFDRF